MEKVISALARTRTQYLPVGQVCYLKTSEDFMRFEVRNSDYNHKQGMSQYFIKVLNTQYQYSKKILLNTQYFNTFFHLKCIENTNTKYKHEYSISQYFKFLVMY